MLPLQARGQFEVINDFIDEVIHVPYSFVVIPGYKIAMLIIEHVHRSIKVTEYIITKVIKFY